MATVARFDELDRLDAASWEPFTQADRVTRAAVTQAVRRFGRLKSSASREDDEARLMAIVWACYADAWESYRKCLSEAHRRGYRAALPKSGRPDDSGAFSRYAASYALPEGYVPRSEWERKRSRCLESIVARGRAGQPTAPAVDTARNVWCRQLRQGADDMALRGSLDAFSDAGVRRVRFVTQRDGRVCGECRALDGRTYRLGSQPPLPIHYNCRCLYLPVTA